MIHALIAWRSFKASPRGTFGFVMLAFLALAGVFAEILASPAPLFATGPSGTKFLPGVVHASVYEGKRREEIDRMHAGDAAIWPLVRYGPTTPPDATERGGHPLGTDAAGRDLFARLVWGARTALGLSAGAVLLGMILGIALGGLAGYERGFWNDRLVRFVETVDTFPAIIVVALVRAIEREPTARSLVIAVAFVRWAEVARLVRAEVLRATAEEYVIAARALGASPARVFFHHILPNAFGPAIVSSVFGVASIVLLEAALSFLKMGGESRVASWGETLAEGAQDPARVDLILLPATLLALTVGASYLVASALREAIDPRAVRR